MSRVAHLLRTVPTTGASPQAFISAGWLVTALRLCPRSLKRATALRVVALSPHYFYRHVDPAYARLSTREFVEAEFIRCRRSRRRIHEAILQPFLGPEDAVLDFGCGPGFLAQSVSESVRHLYAYDLSSGVIECARILNGAENVTYLDAASGTLPGLPAGSLDVVYSFAVIQHMDHAAFAEMLGECARLLKPGGQLVAQVQLPAPGWRSEQEWEADRSLKGRLQFRYGLHCFARTADFYTTELVRHGFERISLQPITDFVADRFDDICDQHLLTARRSDCQQASGLQ
jgi:2-polyprenyl-3-methyl-5-hydroxy-6-metoxy-1,4-benzoquinol methylase